MREIYRQTEAYVQEFDRRPNTPPLFIKLQLEKHIGERFNVLLSKTHYDVREGKIFADDSDEPFIDVLARGRDYRKIYGNFMDRDRENAEVAGFQKTEKIMTDPQLPEGAMTLSFSLKGRDGSAYQHNFYDIFTKMQDGSIEARRYSSALNVQDAARFYLEMGFDGQGEVADDTFFLSNPIIINDPRFKTPDELHKYLHREHHFTPVEEFEKIIKGARPSILKYAYNPTPFNLNEALNAADVEGGFLKPIDKALLGFAPVRQVMTGCGFSGGTSVSSFSVSEFGSSSDLYGSLKFDCPHCNKTNNRQKNKLISNCQHCGKDVKC